MIRFFPRRKFSGIKNLGKIGFNLGIGISGSFMHKPSFEGGGT